MSTPNFGPWLSTLQLTKTERQAIATYLVGKGFTFRDLVDSQLEICTHWFTPKNIPECTEIACFRLQNAIANLKDIPPEAAMEVEEECPEIPEAKAATPAPPQSVEQPISSPPAIRPATPPATPSGSYKDWDVEMVVCWIQSNEQMKKIKPDTNQKIIEFVRDKRIDGSMLDETLFKEHKDDLKLISLGGRHKFRKAIRNLVEGMFNASDTVLARSRSPPPPPSGSPSTSVRSSYAPNDSFAQDRGFTASVQSSPQPSVSSTQQSYPPQHIDDHKAVDRVVPFGSESSVNAMPVAAFSQQPHPMPMVSQPSPFSVSQMPPMQEPPVQQHPSAMSSHFQSMPAPQVSCRRWLWFSDDGVLNHYDRDANTEIEDGFNRHEEEIKLTRGPFFSRFPGRYSIIFDHKVKVHRQRNNQTKEQREVIGSDHEMVKDFRIQETQAATYSATVPPGPMHYQYQQNYNFGQQ